MVGMQQLPDPGGISNHAHGGGHIRLLALGAAPRRRRSRKSRRSISAWPMAAPRWIRACGLNDLRLPPEQRPWHRGRRPRADDIGGIAVDGDGPAATSSTTTSPRRWQSACASDIPRPWRWKTYRPDITRWPKHFPAGEIRRRTGPHAEKRCHKIRHRGELCSNTKYKVFWTLILASSEAR